MAHVHGSKKMAEAAAGAAETARSHGSMMGPMMAGTMGPGPHGPMMHGPLPANPGSHAMKAVAAGAGGGLVRRLSRHPLLMFALGVAAGILVYKYRKEIVAAAVSVGEKGKDAVLQAKESLEDIVAETREEGESGS